MFFFEYFHSPFSISFHVVGRGTRDPACRGVHHPSFNTSLRAFPNRFSTTKRESKLKQVFGLFFLPCSAFLFLLSFFVICFFIFLFSQFDSVCQCCSCFCLTYFLNFTDFCHVLHKLSLFVFVFLLLAFVFICPYTKFLLLPCMPSIFWKQLLHFFFLKTIVGEMIVHLTTFHRAALKNTGGRCQREVRNVVTLCAQTLVRPRFQPRFMYLICSTGSFVHVRKCVVFTRSHIFEDAQICNHGRKEREGGRQASSVQRVTE